MKPTSKQIKSLRSRHGLSQSKLATLLYMSTSHIANCEQGSAELSATAWAYWNLLIDNKRIYDCENGHIGCAIVADGSCFDE